jgi:hypothetical protein
MSIEDVKPKRPSKGRWNKGTSGNPAGVRNHSSAT